MLRAHNLKCGFPASVVAPVQKVSRSHVSATFCLGPHINKCQRWGGSAPDRLNAPLNRRIDLRPWRHPSACIKTTRPGCWAAAWFWRTCSRYLRWSPLIRRCLQRVMAQVTGMTEFSRARLTQQFWSLMRKSAGVPAFTWNRFTARTPGACMHR